MITKKNNRKVARKGASRQPGGTGRKGATALPQKSEAEKTPSVTDLAQVHQQDGRLVPPEGGLALRCYRQGLGDCFLLALSRGPNVDPSYVLIDCGVHARQDRGPKRLAQVMDNLRQATGGSLEVVVATHEHADHLSGFVQKDSAFLGKDAIRVRQFWVAWTEKLGDKQADKLRMKRGAARAALEKAIQKLEGMKSTALGLEAARQEAALSRIRQCMDFETMPGEAGLTMPSVAAGAAKRAGKRPTSNEVALEWLKEQASKVHYCEPGEMLALNGVPHVRAYVLGPPRDEDFLKRDLPSGGKRAHGDNEVYLTGVAGLAGFRMALEPAAVGKQGQVLEGDGGGGIPAHMRYPFDAGVSRDFKSNRPEAWSSPHEHAEGAPPEVRAFFETHYFDARQSWRGIDSDWLASADALALNLDSDTNNTSLVLAFEYGLPGQGKVLLFAADAQVGSWLSWRNQSYGTPTNKTTTDDLLKRTVFYKVGHHGSHNATMKRDTDDKSKEYPLGAPYGLELMPAHLLAFIPVDRVAVEKKMPTRWSMPYPPMYETLLRKTNGRVLRADGEMPNKELPPDSEVPPCQAPTGPELQSIPGFTEAKWCEAAVTFKDGRVCPLYYDIFFDAP